MKILHSGDWHVDPRNHFNTLSAVDFIVRIVEKEKPDLFVVTGDIFDRRGILDPTSTTIVRAAFYRAGKVCQTIVIPGNHDGTFEDRTFDNVFAALSYMDEANVSVHSVPMSFLVQTPTCEIVVTCIPFPNKYSFLAGNRDAWEDPTAIVQGMVDVIQGQVAKVAEKLGGYSSICLFHGTVNGGQADNESLLGPGVDIAIPRSAFEGFDIVMAGHLHRRQDVGNVHYCGSIAPFSHSLDGYQPSITEWTNEGPTLGWAWRPIDIPVASQLLTVSVKENEEDPTQGILDQIVDLDNRALIKGAQVRVQATINEGAPWNPKEVEGRLKTLYARSWKFEVETIPSERVRAADLRADTPIVDVMNRFVDLNDQYQPIREDLIGLTEQAEKALRPSMDELKRKPYRTTAVEWNNYFQYDEGKIDFDRLEALVGLAGINGAGKTNAAKAEAFVFFGKAALVGGLTLTDVVKNGTRDCIVTGWIESGGDTYMITRAVKLSTKNVATGTLVITKNGALQNKGSAKETQTFLETLVGSPELYFRTKFARQFEIASVLEMKPTETKDVIQEALNLVEYEQRAIWAADQEKEVRRTLDGIRDRTAFLKPRVGEIPEHENLDQDAVALIEKLTGTAARATEKVDELSGLLNNCQKTIDTLEQEKKRAAGIARQVADLEEQKKAIRTDLAAVRDRTAKINREDVENGLRKIKILERDIAAADEKAEKNQDLINQIGIAEADLKDIRIDLERQIDKVETQIGRNEKAASLIEKVPCYGGRFVDIDNITADVTFPYDESDVIDMAACQFLKDATAARDLVPDLQRGLETLKNNRTGLDTGDLAKKIQALNADHSALGYDPKARKEKKAILGDLKNKGLDSQLRQLDGAAEQINGLKGQITLTDATIKKILDDAAVWTETKKNDLVDAFFRQSTLQESKGAADTALETAALDMAAARESRAKTQGLLERLYADRAELAKVRATEDKEEGHLQTVQAYRAAVGRTGIPYYLLEQALPRIQSYMNDLLAGSSLSVRIEAVRDRATTISEEVGITFQDGNGVHNLGAASGGQANLLAVPFRVALALIEAEAVGAVPENFWIDEGFGAYDSDNLAIAREMLKKIAGLFGRVVFITHVGEMQKIADTNLVVEPSPFGGSSTLRKAA